ncbi:MAG: cysteine desulfurase [Nitrospirae bacterium]|nr:cysteine desulfurase [Nitrospirota bacterium]
MKMSNRKTRRIYLDHNATTPLAPEVRDAMIDVMKNYPGNPSNTYMEGTTARQIVDNARNSVAKLLNCEAGCIIFEGSGSEANNHVLKNIASANIKNKNHIITSSIEHPSVLNVCKWLEKNGIKITYMQVDRSGRVDPDDLASAITKRTCLVSVMTANNETGVIQPIKELSAIAKENGALFHADATQAIGKIPVDVKKLGVDFLSLSGHKFYGPKGIGALYIRKGIAIEPLILGGGQENGLRAGTENVIHIAGLGKASELAYQNLSEMKLVKALRDRLEKDIIKLFPGAKLNGNKKFRLPNTISIILPGMPGASVVMALDRKGIAISAGSACHSGSSKPSGILLAMGLTEEEAHSTIRISPGIGNSAEDIESAVKAFTEIINGRKNAARV